MSTQRRAGTIFLAVNGILQEAKGEFSYNIGRPKRDAIIGADAVHGYKETVQTAFIEGEITDRQTLDLDALVKGDDLTVTLELANNKVIVLRRAWFAADGTGHTGEANITVRWEAISGEEVR